MIDFSHTMTWGELWTGFSGLCIAASFLFRKGGDMAKLKMAVENALTEISELKQEVSQVGQILIKLAVQNEQLNNIGQRMNMMDRRYDELRRGDGYIHGPRGVDKEYP
mgnify:CR=1 FL=1